VYIAYKLCDVLGISTCDLLIRELRYIVTLQAHHNNMQTVTGIEVNSEAYFPKLREYCPSGPLTKNDLDL